MLFTLTPIAFVLVATSGCGASSSKSSDAGPGGPRDCDATHERIGWTASLEAKGQYNVDGTAEIVDDCTVEIRNFTYDGDGITVKIYGTGEMSGGAPDFSSGYAMSEDLKGETFSGETITATLPQNQSLDNLKALSVWCVDAGVDFGSGSFQKP